MEVINAFGESLLALANKFKNVVVLNSGSTMELGLEDFSKLYDTRHFNFGHGVENMVSAAVGFTVRGKLPIISDFSVYSVGRAWEQIRNDICCPNLNIKILGYGSGLSSGIEGAGYQILEDIALMRVLPNMKVLCPADHAEAFSMMEAMMDDYGPSYLRISRGHGSRVLPEGSKFEFGKSHVLRDGSDICLFATGSMVFTALKAAELLEGDGIDVMVVNVSSIKPLDKDTVEECSRKVKLSVTVEDHSVIGGLAAAIGEVLSERNPVILKRIGMQDRFGESGKTVDLYRKYNLDVEGVSRQLNAFWREL